MSSFVLTAHLFTLYPSSEEFISKSMQNLYLMFTTHSYPLFFFIIIPKEEISICNYDFYVHSSTRALISFQPVTFYCIHELQCIWLLTVTSRLIEVLKSRTSALRSMTCLRHISTCHYGSTTAHWNYKLAQNRGHI